MATSKKAELMIQTELDRYDEQQIALANLETELQSNPQFAAFLEARKNFQEVEATVWKNVEKTMIDNNIRSIKTDKITLTIAERVSFDVDTDLLPKKYTKVVPNTTLIGSEFKLTGTPVKGTSPKYTQYLVKRAK